MFEQLLSILLSPEFYAAILRVTTPLLLAAMGGLLAEKSGMVTFGMEGMMLMGCVCAVIVSKESGSAWMGVCGAMAAGMAVALIYAIMAISIGANQIVISVALNIGAMGFSSILFNLVFARDGLIRDFVQAPTLPVWKIPFLQEIPLLGTVFFRQIPIVYLAFLLVPMTWFILYRTTWGLKIRAVGENPEAADAAGIPVMRLRYITILFTGMMAGLAGAFLSIGILNTFLENMSAGRGFIAYTAIIFGKWEPFGVLLGTLLFGAVDALQMRIQALGLPIPYQFMIALPYVITFLVLALVIGKASWPSASGKHFHRE